MRHATLLWCVHDRLYSDVYVDHKDDEAGRIYKSVFNPIVMEKMSRWGTAKWSYGEVFFFFFL